MTDYQLSNDDHEALEKFTKFFLVKAAQIIVQSRLGEKKTTKSKSIHSGSEWVKIIIFNSYLYNKSLNLSFSFIFQLKTFLKLLLMQRNV